MENILGDLILILLFWGFTMAGGLLFNNQRNMLVLFRFPFLILILLPMVLILPASFPVRISSVMIGIWIFIVFMKQPIKRFKGLWSTRFLKFYFSAIISLILGWLGFSFSLIQWVSVGVPSILIIFFISQKILFELFQQRT